MPGSGSPRLNNPCVYAAQHPPRRLCITCTSVDADSAVVLFSNSANVMSLLWSSEKSFLNCQKIKISFCFPRKAKRTEKRFFLVSLCGDAIGRYRRSQKSWKITSVDEIEASPQRKCCGPVLDLAPVVHMCISPPPVHPPKAC